MAVNLTNADSALKSVYLDVVSEQLNNGINPFLSVIKQTTNDVWGKEIRKVAVHGVNGGIGAGTEDGDLPKANGTKYSQFVSTLKNLYGVIEISDKAVRASENNTGAFVNLLNEEMESLIRSSKYNFGRMLFGNGKGTLGKVAKYDNYKITLDDTRNVMEGMIVGFYYNGKVIGAEYEEVEILSVDRVTNIITINKSIGANKYPPNAEVIIHGSYDKEITGLGALFDKSATSLYGLSISENPWLKPYIMEKNGEITELDIQTAIDTIEENSGAPTNFIVCSLGVRRALMELFSANKRIIDTTELKGGFKAMSYNGIPIVADRFCPKGTMYLLNTEDFTLNQLCDWQWLSDDDGRVLKQIPGKPVYTATLVKYADLICGRPYGQGVITGITEK